MPSGSPLPNNTNASYSFEEFLRGWCHRLDRLSAEITAAVDTKDGEASQIEDMDAKLLIARALGHFEEYYEHKSRAAHLNGFALFSPNFCSSFECAFLWVAGFRPRVLLHLVSSSVQDLSAQQTQALDRLKRDTRINEKAVEDELARIQETAAAPPLIDAMREAAWLSEGQSLTTTNEQIQRLNASLEAVIANADSLRVTTGAKAAEILRPTQCLRFLVAAMRLMQRMRSTGMERDNLGGDLDRSNINIYI
ncbi:transcription factor TGA9-like [Chenopodium quinoa]|nr:transcription factor TGA9-like [Chenopodium quinoa]